MATRTVYTSTALEVLTSANFEKHAKGWLGYAEVEANQTGIGTSATDLTNLTVTVTVPANRLLLVTAQIQANPSAAGYVTCTVVEDAVTIGRVGRAYSDGDTFTLHGGCLSVAPSAGSHTYKLQGLVSASTFDMEASATAPAWILVQDIGPSS